MEYVPTLTPESHHPNVRKYCIHRALGCGINCGRLRKYAFTGPMDLYLPVPGVDSFQSIYHVWQVLMPESLRWRAGRTSEHSFLLMARCFCPFWAGRGWRGMVWAHAEEGTSLLHADGLHRCLDDFVLLRAIRSGRNGRRGVLVLWLMHFGCAAAHPSFKKVITVWPWSLVVMIKGLVSKMRMPVMWMPVVKRCPTSGLQIHYCEILCVFK